MRRILSLGFLAALVVAWWIVANQADPDERDDTATAPTPSASASPSPVTSSSSTPATTAPGPAAGVARPKGSFAMIVTYVYDGDTIQARAVRTNRIVTTENPIRIRLVGVNAPETKPTAECWGPQAAAWLARKLPVGTRIWVAPDRDSWDDYGRRLFHVWTRDRFIDQQLARLGHARALRIWPNVTYHQRILAAEKKAATQKRGMWGACRTE